MQTRSIDRMNVKIKSRVNVLKNNEQDVVLVKGNDFDVMVSNISVQGLAFIAGYFLPRGVKIEIYVPGKPFGLKEEMKIKS